MTNTSTERVKDFQARAKARKALLTEKGLKEIPLLMTNEQIEIINAVSKKMGKKTHTELLFCITQSAIKSYCQNVTNNVFLDDYEKLLNDSTIYDKTKEG